MRTVLLGALVCVLSLSMVACEDEKADSWIKGEFQASGSCGDTSFNGTIAKSGGDYYGFCELDGDNFKFEVGHDQMNSISSSSEFNIAVTGIAGPATEGVFQSNGLAKDDESLYTTFSNVRIKNVNTFTMGESIISDECAVELFAEPIEGELEPDSKDEFDYYVRIQCSGLSETDEGGGTLSGFSMEFYFGNCD